MVSSSRPSIKWYDAFSLCVTPNSVVDVTLKLYSIIFFVARMRKCAASQFLRIAM